MNKENHSISESSPNKRKSGTDNTSTSLVRNIKAKFESGELNKDENKHPSILMTPKSIIKKFEAMSRDASMPLNGSIMPSSTSSSSIQNQPLKLSTSKTNIPIPPPPPSTPAFQINLKKTSQDIQHANKQKQTDTSIINSDHINPKSIIERFEQMTKINNSNNNNNNNMVLQPKHMYQQPLGEFLVQNGAVLANSSNTNPINNNNASLTYISSLASSNRESAANCSEIESKDDNVDGQNDIEMNTDEAIYEELGIINNKQQETNQNNRDTMTTSLFEDSMERDDEEDDEITPTPTDLNAQETYSISSSYTGSMINQEFEDLVENDQDATTDYTECTEDNNYTTEQETTCTESVLEEENEQVENLKVRPPHSTITIRTSLKGSGTGQVQIDQLNEMPLFSIKEYRKQKKYTAAGGIGTAPRRSSIMTVPMQHINKNRSKSKLITSVNNANNSNKIIDSSAEDQNKQIKYLERTKELEELIKQEDNVIHQTGIALERCLTDSHFTGSSEHIECNRILLISCQKRQAYLTEINRVRQLILQLNKKNTSNNASSASTVSDTNKTNETDLNSMDLTGLLILSDLQLPLKESYLNKVKSGDEKRIFYFLCLIRNGIQVLQTQVISVQELIATRDNYITFPNRMAISNVDVNFKVKIDVYGLEMLPKETKPSKQSSSATSKFFSPFKHSVFHSSSSSSNNSNNNNNNNHHYNEQSNMGMMSTSGSKSSNFIHIDTIEITNKDLTTNRFKLNISSSSIPLTGTLFVNVRCMPSKSIELKGFMTLFEDSNGLRSWDRRWCFLNNYNISYWKYPEDEYKNSPIGIINLTKCLNEKVTILPRDLCARKYTIELLISESENDHENLTQSKK